MSFRLIVLPPAEEDLTKAFEWYEMQLIGLGKDFVGELDLTVADITRSPKSYANLYKEFRCTLLRRFPNKIWYLIDGESVVVFAIVHGR